jgi:DNA-directed RNA polymerase specialized sigma subunit
MSELVQAMAPSGRFFLRWRTPLHKLLSRTGTVGNAELDDFAQEVFRRLLRCERVDLIEHPQTFLYNVVAEWALRTPCDTVVRERMQESVEHALNTLTLRQREVLKLQFHEGLGYAEIAERLSTTQRSVKQTVANSYDKVRHELDAL